MDESTNDGIVNVGDGNDGGAAMNPRPAPSRPRSRPTPTASRMRPRRAGRCAGKRGTCQRVGRNVAQAAAGRRCDAREQTGHIRLREAVKPTFPISQLPDLRETLDPKADMNPEEVKSREEFTTVYDIIDSMEATLEAAKTSLFAPSMVRVDREEFAGQLDELKRMLPVQLERASALMREAERRLESAQTQANAIIASAQSRAADTLDEANKQAQILVGQENITDKARQRARAILDKAQSRADHLTNGADEYCTTVMTGLQEQLGKLSHDVQAGLNVLEERQRAAGEQMPHLNINDYPEAQ